MERISSIQAPLQGPALFTELKLKLGSCSTINETWNYNPQKDISIKGSYFCIQADGIGKPAKLGLTSIDTNSQWEMVSESNMHLQSKLTDKHNTAVCLDVGSNNIIVTNSCKCLSRDKKMCDPSSQWFKIVNSTRTNWTI
ncbi:hypothetical protein MKW92_036305 [Papaver armeniacum]|nr:hypothetical protein MKW92_036305 [Papaver armeniacum]